MALNSKFREQQDEQQGVLVRIGYLYCKIGSLVACNTN